jgi:hypothetical protein
MLSEAKHPYWIDLTLSAGADIPLLVKESDDRVRLPSSICHAERSEASILD